MVKLFISSVENLWKYVWIFKMMPLPVCLKMRRRGYFHGCLMLTHPSHLATPGWHNGRVAQRKCFHGCMPFLMAHVLGYPAISRMPESKAEGWKLPIEAKFVISVVVFTVGSSQFVRVSRWDIHLIKVWHQEWIMSLELESEDAHHYFSLHKNCIAGPAGLQANVFSIWCFESMRFIYVWGRRGWLWMIGLTQ